MQRLGAGIAPLGQILLPTKYHRVARQKVPLGKLAIARRRHLAAERRVQQQLALDVRAAAIPRQQRDRRRQISPALSPPTAALRVDPNCGACCATQQSA